MSGAVSNLGKNTDATFIVIIGICAALFALIIALTAYFTLKYRRNKHPLAQDIEGHFFLETTWTVLPVILVMFMFYYGWLGYEKRREVPEDAYTIKAFGQMWVWSFEYGNGMQASTLNLPLGRPVKLILNSRDMIHSLYIPAFRVKQDAVPGMERVLWFTPEVAGTYDLFCAEYCGTGHSRMITKAVVMNDEEFKAWSEGKTEAPAAQEAAPSLSGEGLLKAKGCTACHTTDGKPLVGPTLKGIFGTKVRVTTGGKEREVTVDEEYLRRSELEPASDVVVGFPPIMPPQKGVLKEEEIDAIVDYIKGLK
ncbi:MAG: cytochrome c oxidase subunit II [Deltaproteobacteria bacterium]|nr:cytochrome c oxidase subunit II [Deltaproteobacteria bacterium]